MIPILALVGRPNVGKSTLFNRLSESRDALVGDVPGLTRDRHYGYAVLAGRRVALIDTGGLAGESELALAAESQTWRAIGECDHILFLVDARAGLAASDEELAARLRASGKPVWLLVNKAEGLPESELAEFQRLGFAHSFPVSAKRNSGIAAFADALAATLPVAVEREEASQDGLAVAIIGRPNVGKSTLVNRLVGEDRVLASDTPGTTRDAIRVPLERDRRRYVLIDTAGMRRPANVAEEVERLGVMAAIRALEEAVVAIVMTDVAEGVTSQDQRLVRLALDRGRAVVVALNKWDGLGREARARAAASAERRLAFASFVPRARISALHGSGIGELMAAVARAGRSASAEFSTAEVNRVLGALVARNEPPLARGRRIKLRYAHPAGSNPPRIAVHGSQAERLPASYRRYLAAGFREAFRLSAVPLEISFTSTPNPYADKPRAPRRRK